MLSPAWGHCSVACDGLLYVFGMRIAHDGSMLQAYDPERDEWQYVAPMRLHIRPSVAHTQDNRFIYLVGGDDAQTKRYDTVNKWWSTLTPLPSHTSQLWTLTWVPINRSEAYVTDFQNLNVNFNTDSNSWQEVNENSWTRVPSKAACTASCVIDRDVYVFGGCAEPNIDQGRGDCFVFDTTNHQWKSIKSSPMSLVNLNHQHVRCGVLKVPYKFLQ